MVRLTNTRYVWTNGQQLMYIEASGLSTDTKPTTGIITGSYFTEVDTGIVYIYDEENSEWHVFAELGGGS